MEHLRFIVTFSCAILILITSELRVSCSENESPIKLTESEIRLEVSAINSSLLPKAYVTPPICVDGPTITGDTVVYAGIGVTYSTEQGKTNYNWIVTGGNIISNTNPNNAGTSNAIIVEWNGPGVGTISVEYDEAICPSQIQSITIEDIPPCFNYINTLTILGSKVQGSHTNFPFLIKVTDPGLRHISHGGHVTHYEAYDVKFNSAASGGLLKHQIDYYDPINGILWAWVQIPTLNTSNQDIEMIYGNSSIDKSLSTDAVWGDDYSTVMHLGEELYDSGPRENFGVNEGTETVDTGKIGLARTFERAEIDFINISNEPDFNYTTTMSFSLWMYIDTYPLQIHTTTENHWMDVMIKGDHKNFRFVAVRNQTEDASYGSQTATFSFGYGTNSHVKHDNGKLLEGAWHHVAGTWNGAVNREMVIYIDGVPISTVIDSNSIQKYDVSDASVVLGFNQDAVNTRSFDGLLDEVHISSGFKSQDWVVTEFINQDAPEESIIIGGENPLPLVNPSVGGVVTSAMDTVFALSNAVLSVSGSNGSIQWQYSNDSVHFYDYQGETGDTLISPPLLQTTHFRAFVTDGLCGVASDVKTVFVNPGFLTCDFDSRLRIEINPDSVSGEDDLLNFPVLIDITNAYLESVNSGTSPERSVLSDLGYDIVFTGEDGTTPLQHEIIDYNNVSGRYRAWVNVPIVKTEEKTILYVYYGNASLTTDPSTTAVWEDSYTGVWHMEEAAILDATSNGINAVNNNTTPTAGFIGNARNFDGAGQYITLDQESEFDLYENGKLTVSFWANIDPLVVGGERLISKGESAWGLKIVGAGNDNLRFYQRYEGDSLVANNSDPIPFDEWHYYTATYDHELNSIVVYIDGDASGSIKSDALNNTTIKRTDHRVRIGAKADMLSEFFLGSIDELRIQNVARTFDWIKTEYINQKNPPGFIDVFVEEPCGYDLIIGEAILDKNSVCKGDSVIITLSGFSKGDDVNIFWQSSEDSLSWEYIFEETDSILEVGFLTDTMYYRSTISTCCERYSNVVRVDVNPPLQPELAPFAPVESCEYYILPSISGTNLTGTEAYYFDTIAPANRFDVGDTLYPGNSGRYYIFDNDGVCSDTVAFDGGIQELPTAVIAIPTDTVLDCNVTHIELDGSGSGVVPMFSSRYEWSSAGSSTISAPSNAIISIDQPDTFSLVFYSRQESTFTNECTDTATIVITQDIIKPVAKIIADTTEFVCGVSSLQLIDSSTADGVAEILWSTADGLITSLTTDSIINIESGGEYYLRVTDTTNKCVDSISVIITVDTLKPKPNITSMSNYITCSNNKELNLNGTGTDLGSLSIFYWGTENDTLSLGPTSTTLIVDSIGAYWLSIENTDNSCFGVDTILIDTDTLLPNVSVSALEDTLNCAITSIQLSGSGSSNPNPGNGVGRTVSYSWENTNTSTEVSTNSFVPVVDEGYYLLTVTDDINQCSDTMGFAIAIDTARPIARIKADTTDFFCGVTSLRLIDTSDVNGVARFNWTTIGGSITTPQNDSIIIIDYQGDYRLVVEDLKNECRDTAWITIGGDQSTLLFDVVSDLDVLTCVDTAIELRYHGDAANLSYVWELVGGSLTIDNTQDSLVVSDSGTYRLTVENLVNSCDGTFEKKISAWKPLPGIPANINGYPELCRGVQELTYSIQSASNTRYYLWSVPQGFAKVSDDSTTSIRVQIDTTVQPGRISVRGVNSCGIGDSISLWINISDVPGKVGDIAGTESVCQNVENILYAINDVADADTFIWSYSGDSVKQTPTNITNVLDFDRYATSGGLIVYAQNECGDGEPSDTFYIEVIPLLDTAGPIIGPSLVCPGDADIVYSIPLMEGANNYTWSYSGTDVELISEDENSTLTFGMYATSGMLTVFTTSGCGDSPVSKEHFIAVRPIIECAEPIEPANAFTPNGDEVHDTWVIDGIEMYPDAKIEVFDLWGRRVYYKEGGYTNHGMEAWDGKYKGKTLPMDNYFYVIDLLSDGEHIVKGNVAIIL